MIVAESSLRMGYIVPTVANGGNMDPYYSTPSLNPTRLQPISLGDVSGALQTVVPAAISGLTRHIGALYLRNRDGALALDCSLQDDLGVWTTKTGIERARNRIS